MEGRRHHVLSLALGLALAAGTAHRLGAQVPGDFLLTLESTPPGSQAPNFHIAYIFPGAATPVRNQGVFVPFQSVSLDPTNNGRIWFDSGGSSLPGIWALDLHQAEFAQARWGPWGAVQTRRIEADPTGVWYLDAAGLGFVPAGGGTPTPVLPTTSAVDLAVGGSTVFVAESSPAPTGGRILAWDMNTRTVRTVGSYPGLRSIGTDRHGTLLYAGTDQGEFLTIELLSGIAVGRQSVATVPVIAIDVVPLGIPVWATANAVFRLGDPFTPLYSTTHPILDISTAKVLEPAVFTFGEACGPASRAPRWSFPNLPASNTTFRPSLVGGPPGAAAFLVVGFNRAVLGGAPLPTPLDLIGMPGCALQLAPLATIPTTLDAQGAGTIATAIANYTAPLAHLAYGQWFVLDPTANALGVSASPGATFVIR